MSVKVLPVTMGNSMFYYELDCKTVGFFSKSVKRLSPVSLSVFSLVRDLLFDCSRVLEYAKIRTVLQSNYECIN